MREDSLETAGKKARPLYFDRAKSTMQVVFVSECVTFQPDDGPHSVMNSTFALKPIRIVPGMPLSR
jgi:hypothetical protein